MRILIVTCLVSLLAGCSAGDRRRDDISVTASRTVLPPQGVAFVANGAGDTRTVSTSLSRVVAETGTPLQIETVVWSRGSGRYLLDQVDHHNHLAEGGRLAAQVCAYTQAYPNRKVYLVGYSAGCAVVLAAAERLPPDSVERIILLSPAVCTTYDLRPPLRAARGGIDAFYSEEDRLILGVGIAIFGTSDRRCRTAAGRYGFTPIVECPADATLYCRLRQHPWDPSMAWSGNDGGHYGSDQVRFVHAYVLPLLTGN
jgi:pimeloyl-ACP methyl ester carboxylesterase